MKQSECHFIIMLIFILSQTDGPHPMGNRKTIRTKMGVHGTLQSRC